MFFVLADGTECELLFGREGALEEIEVGPFQTLFDRRILNGVEFPLAQPDPDEQREHLRQVLHWFWHDLSHFMAAIGRGNLWWAYGQLEALRRLSRGRSTSIRLRQSAIGPGPDAYPVAERASTGFLRPRFSPVVRPSGPR